MNMMQQTMLMNNGMNNGNPMMNNMMNAGMGNPMMNNMMNAGMGNPMMNNMMNMNTGMVNPMMMNMNTGMGNPMMMNQMMMNQMMMNNQMNMTKKMNDILNGTDNSNDNNNDNNNNNDDNNNANHVPVDLTEQIKKQEIEEKKKLIKQIINKEGKGSVMKHCKELEVISDMAIMGTITRDYITIDTQNNPKKYLSTQNALTSKEQEYIILGILSDYLAKQGVVTAIEKKDENKLSKEKLKEIDTFLQFLINGLTNLKKHEFRFDFGWEENQLLLGDMQKKEEFMDELRVSLGKGLKIPNNHMIITYPRMGSVLITVIFKTEDFNNISVNQLQKILSTYAPHLNHLVSIESNLILDGVLLNPELLDSRGDNKNQGWGYNEMRGGRPYYPPKGWVGYGLRVLGKYDKGNNVWLNYNGAQGEWCVAYHGASSKNNQNYNVMRDVEDANHPGQKVGEGVYCSPKPNVLDSDGGIVQVGNKKYKIGFMLRVKPDKIRIAKTNPDYWVLNGNSDEIRPYRILIKNL